LHLQSSSYLYNVRQFGATGDAATLDTPAIQAAIDACAHGGGGRVQVPAGQYLIGSIALRDNITLHLEAGAVLLGSDNPADYPLVESRWEGVQQTTHAALIMGTGLRHIAVVGRGTVEGRGQIWWRRFREKELAHPRPRLIEFSACTNVLIEGITATNSPAWTIHPLSCENVMVDKVSIINSPDSPNTDGINPDSCRYVHISNCHISAGDDCITLKSGTEHEGRTALSPCEDITITNCTMARGHGGVVIGSEMSGGVRNVTISNCVFVGTDRGIRIKSRRGRGGTVEDIRVTNVLMQDVLCPFTMNLYYHFGVRGDRTVSDKRPREITEGTPRVRRVHFSHITARNAHYAAGFLYGLAEMPLEDISFDDVSISMSPDAQAGLPEMADGIEPLQRAGLHVYNARRLRLHDVDISGQAGPAVTLQNVVEADTKAGPT